MSNLDKYKIKEEYLEYKFSLDTIQFETTEDIPSDREIIGQQRAVKAIEFGLKMKQEGYNIYVAGLSGTGRNSYTKSLIINNCDNNKVLKDWVYVNNFKNKNEPVALSFEAGKGKLFKQDINDILDKIKGEIPKIFNSKEYEYHNRLLMAELEGNIQSIIDQLNEFSKPRGFKFQITERGLLSVPIKADGTLMKEEELGKLTALEVGELREKGLKLNQDSKDYIDKIKGSEDEYKIKKDELDRNVARSLVGFYGNYLLQRYSGCNKTETYINDFCNDIVDNIDKFKQEREDNQQQAIAMLGLLPSKNDQKLFDKYNVNLLIDNSECDTCNIIEENNPTYHNLIGVTEYKNEVGALTTNFMEIKPGAFHKANGGYLILNVKDVLTNAFAWDSIKRTLKTGKITIESLNKQYGYVVTSTLKPEPIELDVKVILVGEGHYYSLLYQYEEDFRNLFKVVADFDIEIDKNEENILKTIKLISNKCNEKNLKHFDKSAVERLLEYSLRLSDNKEKLTARYNKIIDIIYESNVLSDPNSKYITRKDVDEAIRQKRYRSDKYEEKLNEMFEDGTLLIDVCGEKIGQINGLAVMGAGEYSFGKPSKITASTYRGRHGVINIEREVKQSGKIHDKGVLILSGYLGARYGKEKPLSITTSITFEQNYSGVDGDSASSTELYAIISSMAEIPIKQSIAVTGSISQKGEIQPIGGINEKIEGFFDVCKLKGFTNDQGVIMPVQNVKNLILKEEVVKAIKEGKFSIYPIGNVEQGLEILTGKTMDEIDSLINQKLNKYREDDKEESSSKKDNEKKDK